jgi:hypothetical protein
VRTLAAVVVLLAAGCAAERAPAPPPPPAPPPFTESALPPSGAPNFEIGSIDSKPSEDGTALYVEGMVRNVGSLASRDVKVRINGLDAKGSSLARAEALPTPQIIPPGGAARFVARLPNDAAIRTFHVEAIGR